MFDETRTLLVGATGKIGREVMRLAGVQPELRLVALTRREAPIPEGVRMEMVVAPTESWGEAIVSLAPRAVICALGTTRAEAGSEEAFREVDHDLVMAVAQAARDAGTETFVLVSSVGADRHARLFYPRVKGEVEDAIGKLRFKRLNVLRPGLLRGGQRPGDTRPVEALMRAISPLTDLFLQGKNSIYRSIPARTVAGAAVFFALARQQGKFVHEHDGIVRAARQLEREALEN